MRPNRPEAASYNHSFNRAIPEQIQPLVNDRNVADKTRLQVRDALYSHVVAPPENIYTPTNGKETIDVGGQGITFEVRKRKIKVGECEHEVAETIVEPKDPEIIKETHIILGGYSVNTPHYYQNFIPFAVTGIRYVFINLLGGGTEEYANRSKRISLLGGKTNIDNDYLREAAEQISNLIEEFNDSPIALEGYSLGGLIVSKALARPDLLPDRHVRRINGVNLDAPVPTGAFPLGTGMHLLKMVGTSVAHGFPGAFGASAQIGEEVLGKLMMPELRTMAHEGEEDNPFKIKAKAIIREVNTACFRATGVFPELVAQLDGDPLVKMSKDKKMQDHRDLVSRIPIKVIFRPGDKTVPASKIFEMVKRWRDSGYEASLIKSRYSTNSHMDLSGLQYPLTWHNGHGQAGRLNPR
ncbi:MAG: hypothetical protein Q8P62_02735 [Candidatus Peregrinibacteria bacterium]|nr:hypothetical protein [Candidatus Peregrinibacteria bacterium]